MRLLNILVIAALIAAATVVYKIKFDSTLQAEQVAKLRGEIRHQRNVIAALRAEWAKLDTPSRIEKLAKRYLSLQPIKPTQFDTLDDLPPRPPPAASPAIGDPIAALMLPPAPLMTGAVPATRR